MTEVTLYDTLPEGWLTAAESRTLADLAVGRKVLEIGSWLGRSTVVLASVAKTVVAVDHHHGPPYDGEGSTLQRFLGNLHSRDIKNVIPILASSQDALPLLEPGFDIAFIDGAHEFPAVLHDGSAAWRLVRPGGLLIFHDYSDRKGHPGVNEGVDTLCVRWGAKLQQHAEALAIVVRKVV